MGARGVRRGGAGRVRARRGGAARAARPDDPTAVPVLELRVNGVFVMDTRETSHRAAAAPRPRWRQVERPARGARRRPGPRLHRCTRCSPTTGSSRCVVVEIEDALVGWMRDGTDPARPGPARRRAAARSSSPTSGRRSPRRPRRRTTWCCSTSTTAPATWSRRQRGALPERVPRRTVARGAAPRRRAGGLVGRRVARRWRRRWRRCSATSTPLPATTSRLQDRDEQYWLYRRATADLSPTGSSRRVASQGMDDYRIEHDSMGEVQVPAGRAVAGPDPARGRELPDQRHARSRPSTSRRSARVKAAAAQVNAELGVLDRRAGRRRSGPPPRRSSTASTSTQFPIDVFQTGSGTSSNMNMNEVLASLAARAGVDVHPNDHVNASQSSNDTFPTSIHVAATVGHRAAPGAGAGPPRRRRWRRKAEEFADVVKSGRTHLMDATPVMLGQELGGYAAADAARHRAARGRRCPRVAELPAGRHRGRHRHQHARRASRPG